MSRGKEVSGREISSWPWTSTWEGMALCKMVVDHPQVGCYLSLQIPRCPGGNTFPAPLMCLFEELPELPEAKKDK